MANLLPRVGAIITLLGWGFTLWVARVREFPLLSPSALSLFLLTGLAPLVGEFVRIGNARLAAYLIWFGAGIWAGASYLDLMDLGFVYLIVGLVQLATAFWIERGRRAISLIGPAAFVGAILLMILIPRILAQA